MERAVAQNPDLLPLQIVKPGDRRRRRSAVGGRHVGVNPIRLNLRDICQIADSAPLRRPLRQSRATKGVYTRTGLSTERDSV